MKKVVLKIFFVALVLAISVIPAQSFNPAAHVYIADHLYPYYLYKTDLFYGSIAPDMAIYTDPAKWPEAFYETHYKYAYLPFAQGASQLAFVRGWFTHNEINGADHYAHGVWNGVDYDGGYVTLKARSLLQFLGYGLPYKVEDLNFAHFVIEAAIDLLLKEQHDRFLANKLLLANLFRSPMDRELLTKVLVLKNGETDWINLVTTEITFRSLIHQYATALAQSNISNKNALINLGVQLAQQLFGIPATPELLSQVLEAAIYLCQLPGSNYYYQAVRPAIQNIPH